MVLIQTYLQRFYDEFDGLLRSDRDTDVARMYSLVARLPSGLEQMKMVFDAHVLQRGTTAIDKCQEAAANVSMDSNGQWSVCVSCRLLPVVPPPGSQGVR